MTTQEHLAIQILTEMVKGVRDANDLAHKNIMDRIDKFTADREKREAEVNALLVERETRFESHIGQARDEAIYESTKPSLFHIATEGLGKRAVRGAAFVGTTAGAVLAVHHWWGS